MPAVEIDKNDARTAGNFPAAEAAVQILVLEGIAQGVPERLVRLGELGVVLGVGAQEDVFTIKGAHGLLRLAGDDLIDAADLVAHFPADLEKMSA